MKLDRMLGILTLLLQNNRVTAPVLAEKFEVSRRTINRDIDALCMAGIPIVTHQGSNGGISIAEGYKLDKSVLTSDELSSIVTALKAIGSVTSKSQIERTLDKLSIKDQAVVSLHESIVIDLASHYKGDLTQKIELIKQAIKENKLIEFTYCYEKGENLRCIEPYYITFQWTGWYVFGFCLIRNDWRLFKLPRLIDLKKTERSFSPRSIPPEKNDLNAQFTDNVHLLALFHPSVKFQLVEAYGPDSFSVLPDGWLKLETGYTNKDYILSWLLGFGDKVQVIEPLELREQIIQIAKNISYLYLESHH